MGDRKNNGDQKDNGGRALIELKPKENIYGLMDIFLKILRNQGWILERK